MAAEQDVRVLGRQQLYDFGAYGSLRASRCSMGLSSLRYGGCCLSRPFCTLASVNDPGIRARCTSAQGHHALCPMALLPPPDGYGPRIDSDRIAHMIDKLTAYLQQVGSRLTVPKSRSRRVVTRHGSQQITVYCRSATCAPFRGAVPLRPIASPRRAAFSLPRQPWCQPGLVSVQDAIAPCS